MCHFGFEAGVRNRPTVSTGLSAVRGSSLTPLVGCCDLSMDSFHSYSHERGLNMRKLRFIVGSTSEESQAATTSRLLAYFNLFSRKLSHAPEGEKSIKVHIVDRG